MLHYLFYAEVKLPALFSDNMVLQQGKPIPIWGWAEVGENVTVSFANQQKSTITDANGKWLVVLKKSPASAEAGELSIRGKNSLKFKNVLVGEVWVCSGQSNMAFALPSARDSKTEIVAANYPQIRMFTVAAQVAAKPQSDCIGNWVVSSPETAVNFSAVGYFFARYLYLQRKVPVGIINSSWSGVNIVGFIPREDYLKDENISFCLNDVDERLAKEPNNPFVPTSIFNAMIAPLAPYAISGFAWYQGETNAMGKQGLRYRHFLPALIHGWRASWGDTKLPFLYFQLPNYGVPPVNPGESDYAEVREAQMLSQKIPHTGMVVTIDIGDANNIHPPNKQEFARRLGLAAEAVAYHARGVKYHGPLFQRIQIKGNTIQVHFQFTDKRLKTPDNKPPSGFYICGADQRYYWATAKIIGNTVELSCPEVKAPTAVRYGWADSPICNLYNGIGLPASPFRSNIPADPPPVNEPWR